MNVVKPSRLEVAEYPIGLDSRVNDVIRLLLDEEVGMVGICGMGGIGKTTLAKAVYNTLCSSFETFSFLANVREGSKQHKGIVALQKQVLRDAFRDEREINSEAHGIRMIKERIGSKKVLLVIDDIDHADQLYVLTGSRSGGFGGESRIIITSRDEKVLNARKNNIYRIPAFDPVQSLQLFSLHAFGQSEPTSDWKGVLSKAVVSIAGGIPLCLKVFGPLFSNLESSKEWESMLKKLQKDQYEEVHVRLKISYDSLDEKTKCIFLDIACFLLGNWDDLEEAYLGEWKRWEERSEKQESVMQMWEGSELYPAVAVAELQRKSLISINDKHGTFEMHDHIRDMGRNIVQQQRPAPTRLWENSKIEEVLQRKQGTENIEGIIFERLDQQHMTPLNTISFRNMVKLRILDTRFCTMDGSYHHLPNSLKFLRWWRCPLKSLPIDFPVDNIVVLDLTESKIKQFQGPSVANWWPFGYFQPKEANHSGKFSQLKVLILKRCKKLKSTSDFRVIPNATKLIFEWCTNLGELHESIGDLQSLVCLNLTGCCSLKQIPDSICRLSSLEILNLDSCRKISTLPENLGDLRSLKKLFMRSCWSLRELPKQIGRLKFLRELQLSQGEMQSIPDSVGLLTNLQELHITNCRHLKTIPDISNLHALRSLNLSGCPQLMDVPGLAKLRCLEYLNLNGCDALRDMEHMMKDAKLEHCKKIYLPGRPSGCCYFTSAHGQRTCAMRHDYSFIIFERAKREDPRTEPVIQISPWGAFIPPKEDEKEKADMIRDGEGYRRIDITFEGESNFSGDHFDLFLRWGGIPEDRCHVRGGKRLLR